MQLIDALSSTAVKLIAIASVFGGTLGVLDARHAKASDFKAYILSQELKYTDQIEEDVKDVEDAISRLKVSGSLGDGQQLYLNQLIDKKARYLRKLKRLNKSK